MVSYPLTDPDIGAPHPYSLLNGDVGPAVSFCLLWIQKLLGWPWGTIAFTDQIYQYYSVNGKMVISNIFGKPKFLYVSADTLN